MSGRTGTRAGWHLATIVGLVLASVPALLRGQARYAAVAEGETVRLEDRQTRTVATVVPSVGNIAIGFTVNGQQVLRFPHESVAAFKVRPGATGIPFMGPWANRLDEQAFYANGTRYAFDMAMGNVRGETPIHGFLTTTDAWRVVAVQATGDAAIVTSRLDVHRNPAWMRQWPFAHTVQLTYRLSDGTLEVATSIENLSTAPMPVAIGFHPYFQLTDSPRDEWTLTVNARTRWLLDERKLPSGRTEPASQLLPGARVPLGDYNLDDVFGDLVRDERGRATMSVSGRRQRLDVVLGPNYRSVVVWAPSPSGTGRGSQGTSPPAERNFICIEPMAGITNAVNLAHKGIYKELQSIPPGGTWSESFWIRPSGF